MFRKKVDKDSILEQIEAKSHVIEFNVNANKFFAGAIGFTGGINVGGAMGAAAGAAVGVAGLGVGALVTTPIGYLIGTAIGAGMGVSAGRYAAEKIMTKEQESHRDKFASHILISNMIVPDIVQEVTRMQKLMALLYQHKIVKNTKSNFFDQLDTEVFSITQRKLYTLLLEQHVMKMQFSSNRSPLTSWKDQVKASALLNRMQEDLSKLEVSLIDLILDYVDEKKQSFNSQPSISTKMSNPKVRLSAEAKYLNGLLMKLLWAEKDEDCDIILDQGIKSWPGKRSVGFFEAKYAEEKPVQRDACVVWHLPPKQQKMLMGMK